MKFYQKLAGLRWLKDVSQAEAARALGISRRSYVDYEAGRRYPRKNELYHKMARYFDTTVGFLLVEDEPIIVDGKSLEGATESETRHNCVQYLVGRLRDKSLDNESRLHWIRLAEKLLKNTDYKRGRLKARETMRRIAREKREAKESEVAAMSDVQEVTE